jgi:hypothetical protein
MTSSLGGERKATLRARIGENWLKILTAFLAILYVYIGVYASGIVSYAAVAGGLAVLVSLSIKKRYFSLVLVAAGAVPLAILTWWSIVTPIIASLSILFVTIATRRNNLDRVRDVVEASKRNA